MALGRSVIKSFIPKLATNAMVVEILDAIERNDAFLVSAVVV